MYNTNDSDNGDIYPSEFGLTKAKELRDLIFKETGCTASAGVGPNMLLARLATKRAKPNGQFVMGLLSKSNLIVQPSSSHSLQSSFLSEEILEFFRPLLLSNLPGVGSKSLKKLREKGLHCCKDLWNVRLDLLKVSTSFFNSSVCLLNS
jgi:nucleotidyltransferase/DNA polymerase involved in DNA repair